MREQREPQRRLAAHEGHNSAAKPATANTVPTTVIRRAAGPNCESSFRASGDRDVGVAFSMGVLAS